MTKKYEFYGDDPKFKSTLITFILLIGGFFGYLNETLLNIALTKIMEEFSVEKTSVQWMATGFMLIMGAFSPISASIVQWFSTRKMLLMTLATFLIGTIICALAPSFSILLVGRLVQALATTFLMPVMFNTILLIYSPERRGAVMGLIGMIFMVAPAIGPTISGIIVQYFNWRFLFIFTMPFIILSMILAAIFLNVNMQEIRKPKIDIISACLSIVGLGGLVYVTSSYSAISKQSFILLSLFSIVAIIFFVRRQFKLEEPLVNLSVFKIEQFSLGVILFVIVGMIFMGSELIIPMYMQQVVLLSSSVAGLVLLPGSVLNALISPVGGNILDRKGPRYIIFPGAILMSVSLFAVYLLFDINTSPWLLTIVFMLLATTVSMVMMPAETNSLNFLPVEMYPHGTAVMSTIQPVSGALGSALFVGILSIKEKSYLSGVDNVTEEIRRQATMSGFSLVYLLMAIFSILAIVVAFKMRKKN